MTKQYFMYMFQLDRFRVFEVNYIQKTIYKGTIGKDRSTFTPDHEVDEFSTSADLLNKNKSDIITAGQAQEKILADYPIARNFYGKWDNKHLKSLTDEEYEEMVKDLNVLKDHYNYIEKEVYKPNPDGFTWEEEVELSKMKPKNKVGESKEIDDEEYEKLEEYTNGYDNYREIITDKQLDIDTWLDKIEEIELDTSLSREEKEEQIKKWQNNITRTQKEIEKLKALDDEAEKKFKEEYGKLEEDSIEDYWDAVEIIRDGFMALMKFNFGTDSKGNNYIITVDSNDVNRFFAKSDSEAIEKYERFKEDWGNSEHGDLAQNIKPIVPRYESKEIKTEGRLNKDDIVNGFEGYTKSIGLEPEEVDTAILGEYLADVATFNIIDDNDLNILNEAEDEIIKKYNLQEPDYDDYDTGMFYESEDVAVDDNTEDKLFSGVEFEEKIPHRMRFKQWDIIINDIDEGHDLYWVTQQFFGKEEVEQFAKAFKELPFDKAYVTVRDLSTYQFNEDEKNKVFVIINNHGRATERINSYNYENKIKENGYDFDYETGKWSNEE